jgi:predicted Zn-dependent protease with MMP-like domain
MDDDDSKFYAPDAAFIKALAAAAIANLPAGFRDQVNGLALEIKDFCGDAQLDDLGLEDPYELASVIQGSPARLVLFRRPILDEWAERADVCLADLVAEILLPDLAQHFDWSDEQISAHPLLVIAFRAADQRLSTREG